MDEIVEYYRRLGAPGDQQAVISLLREVQSLHGGSIPQWVPEVLAQKLGTKPGLLLALIRRIPSLRLSDRHTLELCGGPNCGKHAALAAAAERLCRDKNVTLKFVPCMRLCGKGPNLKWDGTLYHKADEALIKRLLEEK